MIIRSIGSFFHALAFYVVWWAAIILHGWKPLQGRVGVLGVTEAQTDALRGRLLANQAKVRAFFAQCGIELDEFDCLALPPSFFTTGGWQQRLTHLGITRLIYSFTGSRSQAQCHSLIQRTRAVAAILQLPAEPEVTCFADLDDTALPGGLAYLIAEKQFVALMTGVSTDADHADAKRLACYRRLRFVENLPIGRPLMYATYETAYRELAEEAGLPILESVLQACRRLVDEIYTYQPCAYEGALETLVGLLMRGCRVVVCTRGDLPSQIAKAQLSGVAALVEEVVVMQSKTTAEYQALINALQIYPPHGIGIGDSYAFDVAPCLELGMHGAEVATGLFTAEYHAQARDPRAWRVSSLACDELKAEIVHSIVDPNRIQPFYVEARREAVA